MNVITGVVNCQPYVFVRNVGALQLCSVTLVEGDNSFSNQTSSQGMFLLPQAGSVTQVRNIPSTFLSVHGH